MRTLSLAEVLALYGRVMEQSGGAFGLRDQGALQSALAQPLMTFSGEELYPTLAAKAVALAFSLIGNHPFVDGNKRIGHAAMEVMLILNGFEINAPVEEQERLILSVAAGNLDRDAFVQWLEEHMIASDHAI